MADRVTEKNRDTAIDVLKFLAVFLVMNSHMGLCYPKCQFLATGGAIGDALFFFASGFTLFLGRSMRFDEWYKRRICRIYPSIIAAAIVACVIWGIQDNIGDVLIGKRYWFIGCILVYYVFLYPLKFIKSDKVLNWIFTGTLLILLMTYFVIWKGDVSPYHQGTYRYLFFFIFMLLGAIMGKHSNNFIFKWWHLLLFTISIALWFLMVYIGTGISLSISVFCLLSLTYCLYCILKARVFSRIAKTHVGGGILLTISKLCLEVYLMQKFVFTDSLNYLFPFNVPIIMIAVIIVAYIVKVVAEFILQTFRTEPYDWKAVLLWRQ